jgi:predicted aspartyl protease
MTVTVTYGKQLNWGTATNYGSQRPYTHIDVHGPAGTASVWTLIDTGADYLALEDTIANKLNIDLTKAPKISIAIAVGSAVQLPLVQVDVTIEGFRVSVDAVFGAIPTPLLGRLPIIAAMKFGMDGKGWLHG